jgi:anti-anti-sigma regulatory factor
MGTFNDTTDNDPFKYVLGEKDDLLLVLFCGKLGSREVPILEECEQVAKDKPQPIVIISFRDLAQLNPGAHATIARLQKTIRDKGKILGLCSLKPDVKNLLLSSGIVRENEIFNNIPDAWKALTVRLDAKTKAEKQAAEAAAKKEDEEPRKGI